MKKLVACFLLVVAGLCNAQTSDQMQGVTFVRQNNQAWRVEKYPSGSVQLPAWPGSASNRGYFAQIMATPRPPNTAVMWGAWSFMSRGMFLANPNAHVAFVMRSLSTSISNIGEGVIVGGLSAFSWSEGGACLSGIRSQPEVWFEQSDGTAGNRLIGGSFCGAQLQDWRKYNVNMHAASGGYAYSITDSVTGMQMAGGYVQDSANPSTTKLEKATGFSIGLVFADAFSSWEFEVSDISLGWF